LITARAHAGLTPLANGRVLATGGLTGDPAPIEIYRP
jgi:hypothetical protein